MGGRGSGSNMRSTPPIEYGSIEDAERGLGFRNGGETDKWMQSLTTDEFEAVADYSDSYFAEINESLRKGRPFQTGRQDYDDDGYDYNKTDKNIETALGKFNLEKPTVFIRGSDSRLLGGASTVDGINAMVGKVVHDRGYTSTSTNKEGIFESPMIYHISTPSGKGIGAYISGVSYWDKGESEFLFNKGSAFKIKGAYKEGSKVHVNLDYVGRR